MDYSIGSDFVFSSDDEHDDILLHDEESIPECEGFPRKVWVGKCVTLHNENGVDVATGICRNVRYDVVVGSTGPLGDTHVAVQIGRILVQSESHDGSQFSIVAWPIERVFCSGASLRDHEARDKHNMAVALLARGHVQHPSRPYNSADRTPSVTGPTKAMKLLDQESINLVASKDCCSLSCAQAFPRASIKVLRQRMYVGTTFQFRSHMKLNVHKQIRSHADGRKVVMLEGVEICTAAWREIMGVPESTFYRYALNASQNMVAQRHGYLGLRKPRAHTEQVAATLACILDKSADHMPHRSRVLDSGSKVVAKVLPASWKWKETVPEITIVNASFGLREVSLSNLSKIRRRSFEEYDAKKPGDNFARSSSCDKYNSMRKLQQPGSQAALLVSTRLQKHLNSAFAHRDLYYANRY